MDVDAKCARDFPECICTRCGNRHYTRDGVRCCWEARRGKEYWRKTRCAVKTCPGFRKEEENAESRN